MSVFRNYDSRQAGGVFANAFPRVHPHAWEPTQRNVRANPNIPSQPQRIQPHERGTFFPSSASGGGSLAPAMSSGCAGCAGCSGNGSQTSNCGGCNGSGSSSGPSPSELATEHSLPVRPISRAARPIARQQLRGVGALRVGPRSNVAPRLMATSFMGGRGAR